MADPKTKRAKASVDAFLNGVVDNTRRQDCLAVLRIVKKAARAEPNMWGAPVSWGSAATTTNTPAVVTVTEEHHAGLIQSLQVEYSQQYERVLLDRLQFGDKTRPTQTNPPW